MLLKIYIFIQSSPFTASVIVHVVSVMNTIMNTFMYFIIFIHDIRASPRVTCHVAVNQRNFALPTAPAAFLKGGGVGGLTQPTGPRPPPPPPLQPATQPGLPRWQQRRLRLFGAFGLTTGAGGVLGWLADCSVAGSGV